MNDQPIETFSDQPTPTTSARRAALYGTDLVLADGQTWTLADYIPALGLVWDQLYDDNLLRQQYDLVDLQLAATRLLLENHDLPADFAVWLLTGVDPDGLVVAVEAALFGNRHAFRGYSDWATGSLVANGIDPSIVRPKVGALSGSPGRHRANRPLFALHFCRSGRREKAGLLDQLARNGIKPTPPNQDG